MTRIDQLIEDRLRLKAQVAVLTVRLRNWQKCARLQGETLRKWSRVIKRCEQCSNQRKKLYGKTRRTKKRS